MSKAVRYILVSLPNSISPSNDHDEALTALRSAVSTDYGTVFPFAVPEFKIGTLDALVQQADELAKLAGVCEGVVGKVGDSLVTILESDEEKILQYKTVNDRQWCGRANLWSLVLTKRVTGPVDQYLRTFSWNKVKYRADKSIGELMDSLQKVLYSKPEAGIWYRHEYMLKLFTFQEIASIDNDVRSKYNQYNQVKTTLAGLQKKQTYNCEHPDRIRCVD